MGSTNRSQLEDKEEFADDLITSLPDMLYKLTEHHFYAKSQNQYLKDLQDTENLFRKNLQLKDVCKFWT